MPINLIENESHDELTQFVVVEVVDFEDHGQVRDVIEESVNVLGTVKGAVQKWKTENDVCYQVPGGLLGARNGGKKALNKLARSLATMGYGKCIVRVVRTRERRQKI